MSSNSLSSNTTSKEKWIQKPQDQGYSYIYTRHDDPGTHYDRHCHQDKVCIIVLGGDVTFIRDDKSSTTVSVGQLFEVPPQQYHSALVWSQGCDYIVGEMIDGDS